MLAVLPVCTDCTKSFTPVYSRIQQSAASKDRDRAYEYADGAEANGTEAEHGAETGCAARRPSTVRRPAMRHGGRARTYSTEARTYGKGDL